MANWIIPCNLKYYDVYGAFKNLGILDWKQSNPKIEVGDCVYIYVGAPISAIVFKCLVTKTQLRKIEIDDSEFVIRGDNYLLAPFHMELKLIKQYSNEILTDKILLYHDVQGRIMGARRMNDSTKAFIDSLE